MTKIRNRARFTAEQVQAIRADSRAYSAIGRTYGCSAPMVCHIKHKRRYGYVPDAVTVTAPVVNTDGETCGDRVELVATMLQKLSDRAPNVESKVWLLNEALELWRDYYSC